jgi:outer membrane biosynthesis protein TonB
MLGAMNVTSRSVVVALVVVATGAGSAACRSCGDDAGRSSSATDAATLSADAGAQEAAAPYAPTRTAPDDSPEALSVVESALFKLRPQINACYREAAKTNPTLTGEAVLAVTIGGDGHVTDVAVVSQKGLDAPMVTCATGVLKGAAFPPPPDGGPSVVKVPLAFRPPRTTAH